MTSHFVIPSARIDTLSVRCRRAKTSPRGGSRVRSSGGPVKFGPYWLDARLAVGGTAEVYVARPIDATGAAAQAHRQAPAAALRDRPRGAHDVRARGGAARGGAPRERRPGLRLGHGRATSRGWRWSCVDGCDLYRLLRRLAGDGRKLAPGVAVHVAREVLRALESVHGARDASGQPLGIIHRDVTPSNLYLSIDGRVKLGDFGIARSASRATMRSARQRDAQGQVRVPGARAGRRRAVRPARRPLLARRRARRDAARQAALRGERAARRAPRHPRLPHRPPARGARRSCPRGLFEVLERALARDPGAALPDGRRAVARRWRRSTRTPAAARSELGALVRWVQSAPSTDADAGRARERRQDSRGRRRRATPTSRRSTRSARPGEYAPIPSHVRHAGRRRSSGPGRSRAWSRRIATGQVGRGDQVDYMGRGLGADRVDRGARALPAGADGDDDQPRGRRGRAGLRGRRVDARARDRARCASSSREATGRALRRGADRVAPRRPAPTARAKAAARSSTSSAASCTTSPRTTRASCSASTSCAAASSRATSSTSRSPCCPATAGGWATRSSRSASSPSLDIFRAIRDQGRDRLVDLFTWRTGKLTFYADQTAPHVEFPLDLDLPPLVVAGVEAAQPGRRAARGVAHAARRRRRPRVDGRPRPRLRAAPWPPLVKRLLDATDEPRTRARGARRGRAGTARPRRATRSARIEVLLAGRPASRSQ